MIMINSSRVGQLFSAHARTWCLALGTAVLLSAIGACNRPTAVEPKPASGEPFPILTFSTLTDGKPFLPDTYRGKALVINFWATWCEPCRKEMPSLERLHRQADPDRIAVLGVSVDTDINLAREFLLQYQLSFANFSDVEQKLARGQLNIQAFPVTFLVAADGTLKARITGIRDWASPESVLLLEQMLAVPVTQKR